MEIQKNKNTKIQQREIRNLIKEAWNWKNKRKFK